MVSRAKLKKARAEQDKRRVQAEAFTTERLASIRTVRTFAREKHELEQFQAISRPAMAAQSDAASAHGKFMGTVDFGVKSATVGLIGFGASMVRKGSLSAGGLTSFVMYTTLVGLGIAGLYKELAADWQTPAARVMRVIQRAPKMSLTGGSTKPRLDGHIEFEQVGFSYDDKKGQVLKGVTFCVKPGEVVALSGPSGCGKSTVGRLLLQMYLPTKGRILVDGLPATAYDPSWLRDQIGVVEQDARLFSGSIADNIKYGHLDADKDAIERAAKTANAHEFIVGLKDGYDTQVGEGGRLLSGGQR
jgi:ATP-binding cassette subfamily B protein